LIAARKARGEHPVYNRRLIVAQVNAAIQSWLREARHEGQFRWMLRREEMTGMRERSQRAQTGGQPVVSREPSAVSRASDRRSSEVKPAFPQVMPNPALPTSDAAVKATTIPQQCNQHPSQWRPWPIPSPIGPHQLGAVPIAGINSEFCRVPRPAVSGLAPPRSNAGSRRTWTPAAPPYGLCQHINPRAQLLC
jgi:hypothetical protein